VDALNVQMLHSFGQIADELLTGRQLYDAAQYSHVDELVHVVNVLSCPQYDASARTSTARHATSASATCISLSARRVAITSDLFFVARAAAFFRGGRKTDRPLTRPRKKRLPSVRRGHFTNTLPTYTYSSYTVCKPKRVKRRHCCHYPGPAEAAVWAAAEAAACVLADALRPHCDGRARA